MRKNEKKVILILLSILVIISIGINVYAHPGRTDSSGGHKDNKNKSGLGSYHYHCGGHPAHLHTNGVCPYSSGSSSSTKTTATVPIAIAVTDIKINENVDSLREGNSQKLTVTIIPNNATDKNITWKSSDENIATVTTSGEVLAKKHGIVYITATSNNGKKSTVKINIEESTKTVNSTIINTLVTNKNNITDNILTNNQEDSNPLVGMLTLAIIGGAGYFGYKKLKK